MRSQTLETAISQFDEGVRCECIGRPAATFADVAAALSTSVDRFLESLIVGTDGGNHLVFIFGDRRLDLAKYAHATGLREVRLATREEVVRSTGYRPGEVPPIDHGWATAIWLDSRHPAEGRVVVGGGAHDTVLWLDTAHLYASAGCRILDISTEDQHA
jgi:prolyl-tRNA editing enzyme YbaK/EbsC (Cys-tRNA(Pro) deacylase)